MKTAMVVLGICLLVVVLFLPSLGMSRRVDDAERDLHAPPDDLT